MSKKQKKPKRRGPVPAKKIRRQTPPRHSRRRIPPSPIIFTTAGANIGHTRESFVLAGMMPPDTSERMQPHPTLSRNDSKDPKGDIIAGKIARINPDEPDDEPGSIIIATKVSKLVEDEPNGWMLSVRLNELPIAIRLEAQAAARASLKVGDAIEVVIRKART